VAETKRRWYAPILTETDAAQAIKEASSAFFVIAGLTAVFAVVMKQYANFFDVVVMAGFSLWLRLTANRVAAVFLVVLVVLQVGVTIGNIAGATRSGGTNVLLSIFMAVAAWRGAQAAWLLHRVRSAAPRNGQSAAG
jgi:phage-related protein